MGAQSFCLVGESFREGHQRGLTAGGDHQAVHRRRQQGLSEGSGWRGVQLSWELESHPHLSMAIESTQALDFWVAKNWNPAPHQRGCKERPWAGEGGPLAAHTWRKQTQSRERKHQHEFPRKHSVSTPKEALNRKFTLHACWAKRQHISVVDYAHSKNPSQRKCNSENGGDRHVCSQLLQTQCIFIMCDLWSIGVK